MFYQSIAWWCSLCFFLSKTSCLDWNHHASVCLSEPSLLCVLPSAQSNGSCWRCKSSNLIFLVKGSVMFCWLVFNQWQRRIRCIRVWSPRHSVFVWPPHGTSRWVFAVYWPVWCRVCRPGSGPQRWAPSVSTGAWSRRPGVGSATERYRCRSRTLECRPSLRRHGVRGHTEPEPGPFDDTT